MDADELKRRYAGIETLRTDLTKYQADWSQLGVNLWGANLSGLT